MAGEHRPRTHRLINPELSVALLRKIVESWDGDDMEEFLISLAAARHLLNIGTVNLERGDEG